MSAQPIRPSTDDRTIDMLRSMALRYGVHVVVASRGAMDADERGVLNAALPTELGDQIASGAIDAILQIDDLDEAQRLFDAATRAASLFADRLGTGVHALLVRRDGTVDLALPRSGVSTIRSAPFTGFDDLQEHAA
jgi:hypothetical protein